jgi:hypothetical protein
MRLNEIDRPGDGAKAFAPMEPRTADAIVGERISEATIQRRNTMGKGILLWLIGVPIPIIILLALVFHH